ncbi:homoserine kinase [Friedmanniella luteola]|uniref:Homoserine kinase n=1 Tax=Friedmanniella luteola TaxID=546871 RepID=A0A1H1V6F6_9ACTN|nr:homoserine kinase [Friedmanniella luteola]SDS80384.1 homoserine kinase [Friedmanniella luteola]
MHRLEPGRQVTVEVPATSANLGPGFDCFGLALSWREQVELTVTDGGFVVDVTGEGADAVPRDDSHLILRSTLRGLADLGHTVPGLRLRCHSTIPHGRGLGSSSAAIVAGLLAAAGLVGGAREETAESRRWTLQHAATIEGHPDNVAAAVHGGFVLAWTGSAGVEVAVSPVHPDVAATVFVPPVAVATKAARGLLPPSVPHRDAARNAGRAALLVHALAHDPDQLLPGTADWLHQDQRRPAMPDSWTLMNHLRGLGHAAVISGAGPTVLVLGRRAALQELEAEPLGFRRVPLAVGGGAAITAVDG